MPTRYKRKLANSRGKRKEDNLLKAADAVNKKIIGINAAVIQFNIPKTTLKRRRKTNHLSKEA
ncbi:hypothetical protein E2C01_090723 [Portunus trituberculatus]|uniref:HTH psq-type domain-containing protein n=1 Tax=Portunus trituberculatus TaxID=210409 RepID=A0A5B7JQW0_PORTR|nr:hypothetical protein [Portunus trituberculatus]